MESTQYKVSYMVNSQHMVSVQRHKKNTLGTAHIRKMKSKWHQTSKEQCLQNWESLYPDKLSSRGKGNVQDIFCSLWALPQKVLHPNE